ncbi:MAG TPA: nucleotide disphospho-sugar-binding domain-containing protein [Myxococcaceae bacterium]|nr:nucleotide disphospho-sugar-binding domain-containing protein [Myxococcaceae bacterium]
MAKILCYTSPGRGHLFPVVPILLELRRRGHDVTLLTLRDEVAGVATTGLRVRPIASAIEDIRHDDWGGTSPVAALDRAVRVFVARGAHEVVDLQEAIDTERPDVLLVDFNCWGAAAVAERSGLPWALFLPYFLPWRLPGIPPFGPGLMPRRDLWGRCRDGVVAALMLRILDRNLPLLNGLRGRVGRPLLRHMDEIGRTAPRILYFTAEPFEYQCPERPASVVMIGPTAWEPPSAVPEWVATLEKPLVLVTCSTEYQADGALVSAALEALANEDVCVVATTAAVDPATFAVPGNARVERFVPHGPVLERAVCVVCHGGMGITQKALGAGVPVCVVPFGRDQLEVARHVEVAGAGVSLKAKALTPRRLREAVRVARSRRAGAERIARAFQAAGGATRGAEEIEALLRSLPRATVPGKVATA